MSRYVLSKRSFSDIYFELKKKYPNKPDWWINEHAGLYDLKSELTNIIANDIIDPKTRRSAYMFAKKRSYEPVEKEGAITTVSFTLKEAMVKTLPAGYQVCGQSSVSAKLVYYELTALAHSNGTDTITAQAKQKRTYTSARLGRIEKSEDFYEFPIDGYFGISKNSFRMWIDDVEWYRIDYLYEADETSRVFSVSYDDEGIMWVKFGDGKTGMKPTIDAEITGSFECNEGLSGRVEAGDLTINAGNDPDIISVTCSASSGGNNSEAVAAIKRNAVKTYRLKNAVFTLEDCELAALKASANVVKAKAIRGDQTISVHVIGAGGALLDANELSDIAEFIQTLTAFEDETVLVYNAQIQTIPIVGVSTARKGYNGALIASYAKFGLVLASSSFDIQFLDMYDDSGISTVREQLINPLGFTFSAADESALDYIVRMWGKLLGDNESRAWGQSLSEGDLLAMVKGLVDFGLQSFVMSTPTSDIPCTSLMYIINGNVSVSDNE